MAAPAGAQGKPPVACADFYGNANATWLQTHPLAAGQGSVSAMGELGGRARQQQIDLLQAAMQSPQGNVQKLLGDFWASGLDEAAVERDGSKPIAPLLDRINAIRRSKDIAPAIAALHQVGIPVVFNFGADVDLSDLDRHIGYFSQGGTGLVDPAWYSRDDEDTRTVRTQYGKYVEQILALTGTPANKLEAEAQQVIDLETRIARASRPLQDLRNPRNNYAPVTVDGLDRQYRNLKLNEFLQVQGVSDDTVSIANPALFAELDKLVDSLKPAQWKTYLQWRVGDAMAPYLTKSFRDASFDFRGRVLEGRSAPAPREQQVLDAINLAAGPMLGREYAARYLGADNRARAEGIVTQVKATMRSALERNPRFGDQAKAVALAKLDNLKVAIGTPSRELDYNVQPMGRGSFGGNMLIASTWRHASEMSRIGTADNRRWGMLPQTPALAYDIAQNRLVITAAMLQPPAFDLGKDDAWLYGSFGALVGHELSHAVDNRGRLVDDKLEVRDWWTAHETNGWQALANRVAAQYSTLPYPSLQGVKVNGQQTVDKNIADLTGMELAWATFSAAQPNANRQTKESFFQGWASLWAQQLSAEAATEQASTSVHAPGQWRTNGPLANLDAFGATYGCRVGAVMRNTPDNRITVLP
ncbi:M13 family metallopeptidase [Lysobacter alkalisoli]|uniref:M13 family metallopeptidase n=2 Tax=Marilutibacter alkalisoli TaxID=2591633 RepID=A0A514BR44_9GAMM|nr:M13 family metallopeptidase [Lysobacter alkalisoli]QDH69489.1 M13 family metallopeptidase [Lysobacter alkalisoli]